MYNFIVTITNNSYINMYVTLHPNSLGQYLRKTDIESWLFNFIFHSHNKYCVEHGEFNNSNQLQNSSIETKKLVLCRLSLVQLTPLLLRIFLGSTANSGVRGITANSGVRGIVSSESDRCCSVFENNTVKFCSCIGLF